MGPGHWGTNDAIFSVVAVREKKKTSAEVVVE